MTFSDDVEKYAQFSEKRDILKDWLRAIPCPFCGGKILSDGLVAICDRDTCEFHILVNLVFIGSFEGMETMGKRG